MALKRELNEDERFGLTAEEIKHAEKYLRKYKTKGIISEVNSLKLFELYMIGTSFSELHKQFPEFPVGQIILTCALRGWAMDRERMQHTLRDRVKAKVVKSVIEQVDFLTSMLSVANAEHIQKMREYIIDPNTTKPDLRIESIKEYKEVMESLTKLIQGANGQGKAATLFDAIISTSTPEKIEGKREEDDDDDDEPLTLDALIDEDD